VATVRPVDLAPLAVLVDALQAPAVQRLQVLFGIAPGGDQLAAGFVAERLQVAEAPGRSVAEDDDVQRVGDQQDAGLADPLALHVFQFEFDYQYAEDLAGGVLHRTGEEIAGNAGGHAHGEVAAAVLGQRVAKVGPEAIVVADEAAPFAPVARGEGIALAVDEVEHRRAGGLVLSLQAAIELVAQLPVARVFQQFADVAVQRQQGRHRAEAFDLGMDRLGVEIQLATRLLAALGPGALFGEPSRPVHAQQQAGEDQQHDQDDAVAVGEGGHAGFPGFCNGSHVKPERLVGRHLGSHS